MDVAKRFKLPGKQAVASLSLASLALRKGNFSQAVEYARPAVEVFRASGSLRNVAAGQSILMNALTEQFDFEGAAEVANSALKDTAIDPNRIAILLEARANAKKLQGDLIGAKVDYHQAMLKRQQTASVQEAAYAALNKADIESQLGNFAEAEKLLSHWRDESKKIDPAVETRWYTVAALSSLRKGEKQDAAKFARMALNIEGGKSKHRVGILEALLCAAGAERSFCIKSEQFSRAYAGTNYYSELGLLLAQGLLANGESARAIGILDSVLVSAKNKNPELTYRVLRLAKRDTSSIEPDLQKLLGPDAFNSFRLRSDLGPNKLVEKKFVERKEKQ
jgi:tetratricopeptide (TPR) repeat protein